MKEGLEPSVFRADRTGLRFILGDLQAETMAAIWAIPSGRWVTVREVFEVLKSRRPIAYTTVGTIMARLEKKRLLKAKKVDRAYAYYPTMGQAEFTFRFVARILDQILESYPGAAVSHLAHLAEPESREAVQKLLAHIVERSKETKKDNEVAARR